jgi:hypothetical protein
VPSLIPPQDLGPHGLRAFDVGAAAIAGLDEPERFFDAVVAYARAIDMVESARAEWIDLGRPWISTNPNGAEGIHPQLKIIREAEADAYRARRALKLAPDAIKRAPGRPPGAVSAVDRQAPPVVQLSTKRKS